MSTRALRITLTSLTLALLGLSACVAEPDPAEEAEVASPILDVRATSFEIDGARVTLETPFLPGPAAAELREDVPGPVPLARPPADLAPEFADGFFLVPRHGAMEES